jgi:hypothetical protein
VGGQENVPPLWPQPPRITADRGGVPRTLDDNYVCGRTALGRPDRAAVVDDAMNGRIFLAYTQQQAVAQVKRIQEQFARVQQVAKEINRVREKDSQAYDLLVGTLGDHQVDARSLD